MLTLWLSLGPSVLQKKGCEYKFHTEFQSHEPEFDYLKSLEIEEKINKIKWCRRQNAAHFLLSTNGACKWYCFVFEISECQLTVLCPPLYLTFFRQDD
jgi:hypothetical protein